MYIVSVLKIFAVLVSVWVLLISIISASVWVSVTGISLLTRRAQWGRRESWGRLARDRSNQVLGSTLVEPLTNIQPHSSCGPARPSAPSTDAVGRTHYTRATKAVVGLEIVKEQSKQRITSRHQRVFWRDVVRFRRCIDVLTDYYSASHFVCLRTVNLQTVAQPAANANNWRLSACLESVVQWCP